jgi:tetratricopeptide (TPR) repeat protein
MNKRIVKSPKELTKQKKFFFTLILIILPFLFLLIFEIFLRVFGYGDNLNLFINHPDKEYKAYKIVNPFIGKKYFQKFEFTLPPDDIFLKNKPDNCFRIFVIGSSSVVGFPYDYNLMFSRILHQRLKDAYPNKQIEVINTAITAVNSYTLLDYMNEIVKQKPDALLIYAGHNEFYGAFGVGSNETTSASRGLIFLHLKLMKCRLYQLMRNTIQSISIAFTGNNSSTKNPMTLMARIVNKSDIIYNGKDYKTGINQFKANFSSILFKAENKGIPVFLSNLVCNVKDLKPFKSIKTADLSSAIEVYDSAVYFEQSGDFKMAKKYYYRAKDFDCVRFRASSEINVIIKELANKYKAHFVPTLSYFEKKSPNELIGNNLLTEHVHPNISGYFLIADAFFNEIVNSKIIDNQVSLFNMETSDYYKRNWGYTALDSLVGYHRITNLEYHWPFRDETKEYIDYRLIYKPNSFIDSLAFSVLTKKKTLADAHSMLAKMYYQNHDYYNAYREYNALVEIDPYGPIYYRDAAKCLISINDLPLALKYYNKSLEYEDSFHAFFRAGEIYLIKNDLNKAISYFTNAYRLSEPTNRRNVLTKLYIAYRYAGKEEYASKVLNEIHKIDPAAQIKLPPKAYTYMNYMPVQVQSYIVEANKLLSANKPDDALVVLKASLNIYDSHIANRLIGEIYFDKKDTSEALFYLKKVHSQFKGDPRFLHKLFLVYLANKQIQDAEKCLYELKKIEPNYNDIKQLEVLLKSST